MSCQDFWNMDWFGKHDWELVLLLVADVLSIVCTHELYKFLPQYSHLICSCPVSIVKHIVTKCRTETTCCHCPGASVLLSSSMTASTLLTVHCIRCCDCHLFLFWSWWRIWIWRRVCVANVMIGLLWMFACWWYYWSPVAEMTSLILLHLYDPVNETLWRYYAPCNAYFFYQLMLERRCQSLG
jgi:hypothetical protein